MAEAATNQPDPKDSSKVEEQREVAYYSALVQAWIESKMEFDRSLLTLSAGGIGLLISLLSTIGVTNNVQLWISLIALGLFIACIFFTLWILIINGPYIISLANGNKGEISKFDKSLKWLDRCARTVFIAGVVLASAYSSIVAFDSLERKKETAMFEDVKDGSQFQNSSDGLEKSLRGVDSFKESLRGLNMLSPESPETSIHSLQGLNGLDPSAGSAGQTPISGQQAGDGGEKSSQK